MILPSVGADDNGDGSPRFYFFQNRGDILGAYGADAPLFQIGAVTVVMNQPAQGHDAGAALFDGGLYRFCGTAHAEAESTVVGNGDFYSWDSSSPSGRERL